LWQAKEKGHEKIIELLRKRTGLKNDSILDA